MNKITKDDLITIPNILTVIRILLIPVFLWLYMSEKRYTAAGIVVVISALTDLLDGFIARNFNQVSKLGKMLDPVADKLSQAAIFIMLTSRFPYIIIPFILFVLKELSSAILYLKALRKTGEVVGAQWHGKVNTVLLYTIFIIHIFWPDIPFDLSIAMIILVIITMTFSLIMYWRDFFRVLRD